MTVIHWFRSDLRLSDNPALAAAAAEGDVLPVYIVEPREENRWTVGAAKQWWLYHSLTALNASLGGNLRVLFGEPHDVLQPLVAAHDAQAIYCCRVFEPERIAEEAQLAQSLPVPFYSYNGSLLWEPEDIRKTDGTPYKVFTPFYRKGCLQATPPRPPLPMPTINTVPLAGEESQLDQLAINAPWTESLADTWLPNGIGEAAAQQRMMAFIGDGLQGYKGGRDHPAQQHTSRLAAHVSVGELSAHQLWHAVKQHAPDNQHADTFLSQLGWREFSYQLLTQHPTLPDANLQTKFDGMPWRDASEDLKRWQQGQTGIPMVDAGMRQLWQTGTMHNRLRMITASFLIKNLLIDWRHGERWFWDTLVDADLANNAAGWQWVAGSGADAAPYFRVFNPVLQGEKFDSAGEYVRRFVPELAALPERYLHAPWQAPSSVLQAAGITLGLHYPHPMVDLKQSRTDALTAWKMINGSEN